MMFLNNTAAVIIGLVLTGCVTSRIEDAREAKTGLNEGEFIVVMAKS